MNEHALLGYLKRSGPNMSMQDYQTLNSLLSVIGTGCYQACPQMVQDGNEVWLSYQKMIQSGLQPVKILVVGEFNTGKSTFINAFLGRELLRSEVIPSTAIVTYICYGPQESLYVSFRDGRNVMFDMNELGELTSENGTKYRNIRKEISAVYIYLPLPILTHITLVDSPGVNVRIQRHEEATYSILEEADYVVWVMSAIQAGKNTEMRAISQLPDYLKPLVIINQIDLVDEDDKEVEDILDEIWQRIKKQCRGYIGVSAYQALCGIQQNDSSLYEESRMGKLVEYIEKNLVQQWGKIKLDSIHGQMRKRKKMYYLSDMQVHKKEVLSLQDWIKNNTARKKWENLDNLIMQKNELINKIDVSDMNFDVEVFYKKQCLFHEIEKLEGPVNYIAIMIQESQIINSISRSQIEQLNRMQQGLYQYYYYSMYYYDIVMNNPCAQAFQYLQNMISNYLQYFTQIKEMLIQISDVLSEKEKEYMKDKQDKIKEWKEKNKDFTELSRKVNETAVIDELNKVCNLFS